MLAGRVFRTLYGEGQGLSSGVAHSGGALSALESNRYVDVDPRVAAAWRIRSALPAVNQRRH
jgi:hypothetical protein